ncbi:hypothetical protein L6273_00400 [Candidatus Parcubacteria bacterium]|nr:hypothetical protein [Candidatus Parcubacteria bacterium]
MFLFGIKTSLDVVYPAIEQSKNALVFWKLPKWDTSRVGCGDVIGVKACPNGDNKPKLLHQRCFRPECPVCYQAWGNREANRVVERLEAGEKLYHSEGKKLYRVRHIVFSPEQNTALELMGSVDGFKKLRCECNSVIKKAGLLGGCIIFHSHRKDIVDGVAVWFYSPHFHVLGYGYLINSDKFYVVSGGWIYKNKGVRNTVKGTISYLLTHSGLGYVEGIRVFHSVTWFGIFGYSRMVIKSVVRKVVYEQCEVCNADLHSYDVSYCNDKKDYSDRDNWQDLGYYVRVIRVRSFMLRNYKRHSNNIQLKIGCG